MTTSNHDQTLRNPSSDGQALSAAYEVRYAIGAVLGSGATSQVHDVHDRIIDRDVAMKSLTLPDPDGRSRFVREARITARLDHPNVVPVHDLMIHEAGGVWFTMRKIDGLSLGEALRKQTDGATVHPAINNPNALVTTLLKVCDALSRAHALGIVHRDLKPDNIMLGDHGAVLVVDWGEAQTSDDAPGTDRGLAIGTPLYMSPEQARGEAADPRSDVWSLGAVLCAALIGRPPLGGKRSSSAIGHGDSSRADAETGFWAAKKRGHWDRPDAKESAGVPRPLLAIMARALATAPADRYQDIAACAADLAAWQAGQAISAYHDSLGERLARWHHRHARWLWPTAAAVVLIAVLGSLLVGERLKQFADWGNPILSESFADESYRDRWSANTADDWQIVDQRLVSQASNEAYLVLRDQLPPWIAVEFTGEITPGSMPCDLSVAWFTHDRPPGPGPGGADPAWRGASREGLLIQAGAYDNTACMLFRWPGNVRMDFNPFKLEVGRRYRFRTEIEGDRVRMLIDGREVLRHQGSALYGPGYLALYGYYPGKAFSDLRIWRRGAPERVGALAVGAALLQAGQAHAAAASFADVAISHPGTPLANLARLRQGQGLAAAGESTAAEAAWQLVTPGPEAELVKVERLRVWAEDGAIDLLAPRMEALGPTLTPAARTEMINLWQQAMTKHLFTPLARRESAVPAMYAVREHWFPDDPISATTAGRTLDALDRWEELANFPDPLVRWLGLAALGRIDEALLATAPIPWTHRVVLEHLGDFAGLEATAVTDDRYRNLLRCYQDRGAEIPPGELSDRLRLRLGLPLDPPSGVDVSWLPVAWLIAHDHLAEAGQIDDPNRILALLLAGRVEDAVATGYSVPLLDHHRALARLGAGDQHARPGKATRRTNAIAPNVWFPNSFLWAFADALAGDRRVLDVTLARWADDPVPHFAQRPRLLARCLRGEIPPEALRDMPFRCEGEGWALIAAGMRADLAKDTVAARAAYTAFQALPHQRRLLNTNELRDPIIERMVVWRLTDLAR